MPSGAGESLPLRAGNGGVDVTLSHVHVQDQDDDTAALLNNVNASSNYGAVSSNIQFRDKPYGSTESLASRDGTGKPKTKWFASWFTPSFLVVALVVLNGDSARGCLFPTLWPLVSSLGGDRIMQGYIVSAFSFGRLIISPFFGGLSEVYGYRAVLVLTSLVLCAGTLIYTAADDVYTLLLAQVVMGIGSGTLGVTRAYVAESTQRSKRTVLLAYLTAVQYAGFTVMPVFGGAISDIVHDAMGSENFLFLGFFNINQYTSPAYFMVFLSLLSILLLCTIFNDAHKKHEDSQAKPSTPAEKEGQQDGLDQSDRRCGISRQDVVIYGAILLNIATKGGISIYETLGIQFATTTFSMTPPDAGFLFATFGFIGVIALLYMKKLCQYFNDVQLILGGMALMITCNILLIDFFGKYDLPIWRFYLAIFCMYASGYPIGHTAVIGMFSKVLGKRPQGALMGWFGSAGSLARVVFPIIGGHLSQDFGNNTLFAFAAIILVISCIMLYCEKDEVLHMTVREH